MTNGSFRFAALAVLAGALFATAPAPAHAQLTCSAANSGQQVCQSQNVCRCVFKPGGTMIREPAGYGWDCGSLLYGTCPPNSPSPPLAGGIMAVPGGAYPASFGGGAQVRAAQQQLQRLGFNPGPADGVMGPRTASAIRLFQRSQRLPETGSLTPETLSRLSAG